MTLPRYWLVMPAAGRGKRLGGATPKQFLTVAGRPLIAWALQPFFDDPRCAGVMLAVAPDDTDWLSIRASLPRPVLETTGGAERADSVRLALQALLARGAQAADWVLVHDAARPGAATAEINALVDAVDVRGLGTEASHDDLARIVIQRRIEPRVGSARDRPQMQLSRRLILGGRHAAVAGRRRRRRRREPMAFP